MSAIDVEPDASLGMRSEQGASPARPADVTDGGEAIWGAAFRQTNSVVSAIQAMRNSGQYAPTPDYNPVNDVKAGATSVTSSITASRSSARNRRPRH